MLATWDSKYMPFQRQRWMLEHTDTDFNTSSDEFDGASVSYWFKHLLGALKVMVMKDEAIVLTAAVIRLSPPGTNATNHRY